LALSINMSIVSAQSLPENSIPSVGENSKKAISNHIESLSTQNPWQLVAIKQPTPSIKVIVNSKLQLDPENWKSLQYGVDLPLLLSLDIYKNRWYWIDNVVASVKLPINISYDNISEQYQAHKLNQNYKYQNQEDLVNNLMVLEWVAIPLSVIPHGEYRARLTLEIDHKSLSPLLQVNVFKNKSWQWKYNFPEMAIIIPQI